MKPDELLATIGSALDSFRFAEVKELVDQLDPSELTAAQAKKILSRIRRKRRFVELEHAAGLFYDCLGEDPTFRRQYAQALIDQGRVRQGLAVLRALLPKVEAHPDEGPEVRGLIGRAYKQLYVDSGGRDRKSIVDAIQAYRADWLADPGSHRWHGINLVACVCRARADGIDPGEAVDTEAIARRILDDVRQIAQPPEWDLATAMEAAVALRNLGATLEWAGRYVQHEGTDAFELGSTRRQLIEVWRLRDDELGGALLPALDAALLRQLGGAVELAPQPSQSRAARQEGFEKVYGAEGYQYFLWLETLFERARAICRLHDRVTGTRWGTGFLVRGSDLQPHWGDAPVVVTNSHVISTNAADEAPLAPGQAAAEFTRLPGSPKVDLGDLLFTDPRVSHDVSVLRLAGALPSEAKPLALTPYNPMPAQPGAEPQRVYVVGHPQGGELVATLYDNDLAEYESPYVRYRCPTDPGQSGSPVFNRRWDAFAIHHRARDEKKLNEGVLLESIKGILAVPGVRTLSTG